MNEGTQEAERTKLVEQLLALLHRTGEGMTRLGQDLAEASRSHPTDMTAVSLLARNPATLTVGELGDQLGLSRAATTALVDRLERAGHVHRVRDPRDRRRWNLQVTDAAHQLADAVLRDFLDRTRAALAHYSPTELEVARRFLLDVSRALDKTDTTAAGRARDTGATARHPVPTPLP